MQFTIINPDKMLVLNGIGVRCDFELGEGIHAIQWNGSSGHIEYVADIPNEEITDFSPYAHLIEAHTEAVAAEERAEEEWEAQQIAALDYAGQRVMRYPHIGDQLDDLFKSGAFSDEMTAEIQAVKDAFPKPAED